MRGCSCAAAHPFSRWYVFPLISQSSLSTRGLCIASSEPPQTPKQIPSPSRPKLTVSSGVASLLSKASGRRTPKPAREPTTPRNTRSKSPRHDISNTTSSSGGTLKLSVMIPRLLHRKPPYIRTESPRPLTDTLNASRAHSVPPSLSLALPLTSPTRSTFPHSASNKSATSLHLSVPSESTSYLGNSPASSIRHSQGKNVDVFADDNLSSSTSILTTIFATEDELRTLIDAFQALESRTRRRIQKRRAHRLPTSTPASVDILLEGREWREHRRIPSLSSSSPRVDSCHRHLSASTTTLDGLASDGTSIRSASSINTSLSKISSVAKISNSPSRNFLGPVSAGPPLSTLFRTVSINGVKNLTTPRKDSVSSMATSTSSYYSRSGATTPNWNDSLHPPGSVTSAGGNMQLPSPSSRLSRSKSHLGLKGLKGSSRMFSKETLISMSSSNGEDRMAASTDISSPVSPIKPPESEYEDDPEVINIKRRKEDLITRYHLRLEFLRAKLKSAELHERLLRK